MVSKKIINNFIVITSSTSLFLLATALIVTSTAKNIKNKNKVIMFLSVGILSVLALASLFLHINQLLDWNSYNYPQEMDSYCTRSEIDGDSNIEERNVKTNKKTLSISTNTTSSNKLVWDHGRIDNSNPYLPTCYPATQKNDPEKLLLSQSSQDTAFLSESSDTHLIDNLTHHPQNNYKIAYINNTTPQSNKDSAFLSDGPDTHLNSKKIPLKQKVKHLKKEAEKREEVILKLKKEAEKREEVIVKLEKEAEKREEVIVKLEKEAEKRKKVIAKLNTQVTTLDEQLSDSHSEGENILTESQTKFHKEINSLKALLSSKDENILSLEQQLSSKDTAISSYKEESSEKLSLANEKIFQLENIIKKEHNAGGTVNSLLDKVSSEEIERLNLSV